MVNGTLREMSTSPPPRRRVLWRSPWAWPPAGITLAALASQWFGGVAALTVLLVLGVVAVLGLAGLTSSLVRWLVPLRRLFRR